MFPRGKALALTIALPVMLAACSDTKKLWRESEIEAIASDAAYDAASDATGGVSAEGFEERIDTLERQNRQLELEVASLRSEIGLIRSELGSLESQYGTHTHF